MNKPNQSNREKTPLRLLREKAKLTQEGLANTIGCPRSMVRSYEYGTKTPSLERAVALARALNVSLKELARAMNIDVEGVPNDDK